MSLLHVSFWEGCMHPPRDKHAPSFLQKHSQTLSYESSHSIAMPGGILLQHTHMHRHRHHVCIWKQSKAGRCCPKG